MRGSIRNRGPSWEYNCDIGAAAAERCRSCNRRFWVERKPRGTCPSCGGQLVETEERRRAIKGGFATRKECLAAMNKLLVAVEEQTYVAPTKASVKELPHDEWLPAVKDTVRASTYSSYVLHVELPHRALLGTVKFNGLTPTALNGLYAKLARGRGAATARAASPPPPSTTSTPPAPRLRDAVTLGTPGANPADSADPPQGGNERRDLTAWPAQQLIAFLGQSPTIASTASGVCWP